MQTRNFDTSNNIEVKYSSIQGLGVFALRPFSAWEHIRNVNIIREITLDAPLREDLGERFDHCAYPDGKIFLWGFPDRHFNHSCDPNAFEVYENLQVLIVARRQISAGEEITVDYNINNSGGDSWSCQCEAKRCRGQILGDFFLLPQKIQFEYRPLLADWFIRQHREKIQKLDEKIRSNRSN